MQEGRQLRRIIRSFGARLAFRAFALFLYRCLGGRRLKTEVRLRSGPGTQRLGGGDKSRRGIFGGGHRNTHRRIQIGFLLGKTLLTAAFIAFAKNGDRLDLAPMLTRWLERAGADVIAEADIVMPVPLHPLRLLHRRFNQAAELARPVARRLGRTYLGNALKRTRQTHQRGKGAQARWENVRGAFAVSMRDQKRIQGKRIVLIDDVFTTGATLRACADTLLKAGAASVDVCVLARAVKH